jgi:hypothetical protein
MATFFRYTQLGVQQPNKDNFTWNFAIKLGDAGASSKSIGKHSFRSYQKSQKAEKNVSFNVVTRFMLNKL